MTEASEVARCALTDMRAMLGVLRTGSRPPGWRRSPASTTSARSSSGSGRPGCRWTCPSRAPRSRSAPRAELTAYRIVQEALTKPSVTPRAAAAVTTPTTGPTPGADRRRRCRQDAGRGRGHGIEGMRERAALHGGTLAAGPTRMPRGLAGQGHLAEATGAGLMSVCVVLADDQPLVRAASG